MSIVKVNQLSKRFNDIYAVDGVSFSIEEGEIFGLLGPNGAGKSTLISLMINMLVPNSGDVFLFSENVKKQFRKVSKKIGFIPQNIAFYHEFTAYENIKFFGELYGLKGKELEDSVNRTLETIGLEENSKQQAKNFSGGMMRRLNIGCAIVHKPKLLIMDEPTVGIDPQSRNRILDVIQELNKKGTTIIYTSHYMEEVERICTRLAIVDHGKIIAQGTPQELKVLVSDQQSLEVTVLANSVVEKNELERVVGVDYISIDENVITIYSSKDVQNLDKIIQYFISKNIKIINIDYQETNLESVFLSLTGRKLRDGGE